MKKILTLATLGFVFTTSIIAQPTIKTSFKMKSNLLSTDFNKWTFLDYDGYGTLSNALLFSASTDNVGLELEIDPTISFSESNFTKSLSLEKYNAWVSFGKNKEFLLKLGSWDGRAVGCVTSGNLGLDGIDFSVCYPGMISSITTKSLSTDISSQCGSSKSKRLSGMFQYKNDTWEARFAAMNLNLTEGEDGFKLTENFAFGIDTFMAEGGFNLNNVGRFLASGKFAKEEFAAAVFYEPSFPFLKNLTALVGFTGEYKNKNKVTNAETDLWGWGADIRARYIFDKSISITTMHNFTFNQLDVNSSAPINYGIAMENMINILYNIHPRKNNLKAALNIRHFTGMGADDFKPKLLNSAESGNASKLDWISNFRITNNIEYNFNSHAKINAGIAFNILNCFSNQAADAEPVFNIQVPVVFQVSF